MFLMVNMTVRQDFIDRTLLVLLYDLPLLLTFTYTAVTHLEHIIIYMEQILIYISLI